jgi:hypothetical protein
MIHFSADVAIIFLYYYFNDFLYIYIYIYIYKNSGGWLSHPFGPHGGGWPPPLGLGVGRPPLDQPVWGWLNHPRGPWGWFGHPNSYYFFFQKKVKKKIFKIIYIDFILFFDISAQEEERDSN